ncbi:hypothetical protein HDV05_006349 [Chytridiales sp. JEL 0842]|nr:hypothetical protein HDV05_006349 [Chytridiales sp. JEL 0842]
MTLSKNWQAMLSMMSLDKDGCSAVAPHLHTHQDSDHFPDPSLESVVIPGLEGRYKLVSVIAQGSKCTVYKVLYHPPFREAMLKIVFAYPLSLALTIQALDLRKEMFVALKVLPKDTISDKMRANIYKEVEMLQTFDHQNIVRLEDFHNLEKHYAFALELMPDGDLFDEVATRGPFKEADCCRVAVDIAKGLSYLHAQDVAPESSSILKAKITDFGLSKRVPSSLTASTPCGTEGYAAPEIFHATQIKGAGYTKSVDVWAFGCAIYTMLCGFPPQFLVKEPKVSTKREPGAPAKIVTVIEERWVSMDELVPWSQSAGGGGVGQRRWMQKAVVGFPSPWWDDVSEEAKKFLKGCLEIDTRKRWSVDDFLGCEWVRRFKGYKDTNGRSTPSLSTVSDDESGSVQSELELDKELNSAFVDETYRPHQPNTQQLPGWNLLPQRLKTPAAEKASFVFEESTDSLAPEMNENYFDYEPFEPPSDILSPDLLPDPIDSEMQNTDPISFESLNQQQLPYSSTSPLFSTPTPAPSKLLVAESLDRPAPSLSSYLCSSKTDPETGIFPMDSLSQTSAGFPLPKEAEEGYASGEFPLDMGGSVILRRRRGRMDSCV